MSDFKRNYLKARVPLQGEAHQNKNKIKQQEQCYFSHLCLFIAHISLCRSAGFGRLMYGGIGCVFFACLLLCPAPL
jgi:hypothetical protein